MNRAHRPEHPDVFVLARAHALSPAQSYRSFQLARGSTSTSLRKRCAAARRTAPSRRCGSSDISARSSHSAETLAVPMSRSDGRRAVVFAARRRTVRIADYVLRPMVAIALLIGIAAGALGAYVVVRPALTERRR